MDPQQTYYELDDKGLGDRLLNKARNNPFLVIGVMGLITTVAIGARKFKNRSKSVPISIYLIQLRVAAQSAVIGTLTVGMVYGMLKEYVFENNEKPKLR